MMSYTAERFCDCATSALMSSGDRVGVDLVGHPDVTEAVTDVAVRAQDASHVHPALDRGRHAAQLDLSVLRNGGDTGRQAAGEGYEHVFDRRGTVVLGRENLGVVGVERVLGPVALLFTKSEEALHR